MPHIRQDTASKYLAVVWIHDTLHGLAGEPHHQYQPTRRTGTIGSILYSIHHHKYGRVRKGCAQAIVDDDHRRLRECESSLRTVHVFSWMQLTLHGPYQVLIGDSIVWWRVCVVWKNRIVYCLGPLLIALTIGT